MPHIVEQLLLPPHPQYLQATLHVTAGVIILSYQLDHVTLLKILKCHAISPWNKICTPFHRLCGLPDLPTVYICNLIFTILPHIWCPLSHPFWFFFSLMHVKPILLPSVHPNHFCLISFAFTTFNHRLFVIHVWAQIIGGITFVKICRHFFLCRTLHILPNVMKYLFLTERNWMNSMKKLSPHRLNRHIFFLW